MFLAQRDLVKAWQGAVIELLLAASAAGSSLLHEIITHIMTPCDDLFHIIHPIV